MSYKVEIKSSHLYINFGEDAYTPQDLEELKIILSKHNKRHIILNLLMVEELNNINFLRNHQIEKLENDLSFIIIIRESLMTLFDEDMPLVPTLQEAIDFFNMDEMQRKLMNE